MSYEKDQYVIIRHNGVAEMPRDGSTYWSILDTIHTEYQSAGGNWNRPNMLLLNGKVVVAERLAELAWDYGEARRKAVNAAVAEAQAERQPDWLTALYASRKLPA